jgi:hypothetical protein
MYEFKSVNAIGDDIGSLVEWNDAPERTFEEVKEAFKKANL